MTMRYYDCFDTPIGPLTVAADSQQVLRHILLPSGRQQAAAPAHWHHAPGAVVQARQQILEYLHGQRSHFELQLAPDGSEFQRLVWRTLTRIPYGHTWSYLQLAQCIGHPNASRPMAP
jgi:methylated-DNA-[protein]-cysteine S-methyltransferase